MSTRGPCSFFTSSFPEIWGVLFVDVAGRFAVVVSFFSRLRHERTVLGLRFWLSRYEVKFVADFLPRFDSRCCFSSSRGTRALQEIASACWCSPASLWWCRTSLTVEVIRL